MVKEGSVGSSFFRGMSQQMTEALISLQQGMATVGRPLKIISVITVRIFIE